MRKHLAVVLTVFSMLMSVNAVAFTFDPTAERWGFGADVGVWGGTVDGNLRPAFAANLDYYIDRAFSVGPMVLFSPSSDLTEVAAAGVVRYHYRTQIGNIVPVIGIGFIHASLDDRSSTSYYIPIGLSYEYPLTKNLALSATGILNLHGLFSGDDVKSGTMLFGLRYGGPAPTRSKRTGFSR